MSWSLERLNELIWRVKQGCGKNGVLWKEWRVAERMAVNNGCESAKEHKREFVQNRHKR